MAAPRYRYVGHVTPGAMDWRVSVDGVPLDPRLDLVNHSPSGLSWGYLGSGPAQLALAVLAHHLHGLGAPMADARAIRHHQRFKQLLIASLPQGEPFAFETADVALVLERCMRERPDEPDEKRRD